MDCPKCKSALEISEVYNRKKRVKVKVECTNTSCPFYKILVLSIDDIIGIGRSPETEAESKAAVIKAMKRSG